MDIVVLPPIIPPLQMVLYYECSGNIISQLPPLFACSSMEHVAIIQEDIIRSILGVLKNA